MANSDEDIANFVSFTGTNEQVARGYLDITNNDLMQAVSLFFENPELQSSFNEIPAASSSSAAPPATASSGFAPRSRGTSSRPSGNNSGDEIIAISDDDEDDSMLVDGNFIDVEEDEGAAAAAIARTAQEDEDAALAQRLQQEAYGEPAAATEDGVRAPIGRTTETLVAPSYGGMMGADDDIDDRVLEQLHRRQRGSPQVSRNPFAQSIWDDPDAAPAGTRSFSAAAGGSESISRTQRLAELFRPPYDLMSINLPWDQARDQGKEEKRWILVNVQDMTDFHCQALNRDIWKDELVAELVRESFILLQYSKNDHRAQEYQTFYFNQLAQENPENFPHVSIIDPRTGEQVKVWSGRPFPSAQEFHSQLVEFLDRYSLAQNSKNPVSKQKRPKQAVDVDRMTEEEMLAMAMQNSLENNGVLSGSGSASASGSGAANVYDPDELTQGGDSAEATAIDKGKGKGVAAQDDVVEDVEPALAPSAWFSIPSDRPQCEPANNPAATTRIQFKHANGRVIRRFNLSDPVQRIYEWLKAEPLEGQEGVEFELKTIPQSRDLLQDLDKTIEEVGLKNATVMIELIQD